MPLTIQAALVLATRQLSDAGIAGASRDARILMAHVLDIDASRITMVAPEPIDQTAQTAFETCIARRAAREPVSHILGRRSFYGRDFSVTADVLDPRPETEILVEQSLLQPFSSVLDMGTGSGAILLTLLAEQPLAKGLGCDISPKALEVAQQNATQLGLTKQARWCPSDWFTDVSGTFDLIVSNPPYIALDEMQALSHELSHEPRLALTDEADGLTAYRIIADQALNFLSPRGRVLLEIGPTQGAAVADLMMAAGFKGVRVVADLDGRDRVVCAVAPRQ
ncbi:peptide chain release factor N(5)-glutamine methyltransferase [Pacificibacter marinus]|nr:peptide chain release factor N(5)-glutamine methyltransferase [Pacificibacter marinus]